jgi:hypothetical protein
MTQTSWAGRDANAASISFNAEQATAGGPMSPHVVPEIAGSQVSLANPIPVKQQGGLTFTQTVVALTATVDATLIAANPNRRFLALLTIGAGDVTLAFGQAAVVGQGWLLPAADASSKIGVPLRFTCEEAPLGAVHGISAVNTTVAVIEGV